MLAKAMNKVIYINQQNNSRYMVSAQLKLGAGVIETKLQNQEVE